MAPACFSVSSACLGCLLQVHARCNAPARVSPCLPAKHQLPILLGRLSCCSFTVSALRSLSHFAHRGACLESQTPKKLLATPVQAGASGGQLDHGRLKVCRRADPREVPKLIGGKGRKTLPPLKTRGKKPRAQTALAPRLPASSTHAGKSGALKKSVAALCSLLSAPERLLWTHCFLCEITPTSLARTRSEITPKSVQGQHLERGGALPLVEAFPQEFAQLKCPSTVRNSEGV